MNIKINVLQAFTLAGVTYEPGPAEVPESAIERLVRKGFAEVVGEAERTTASAEITLEGVMGFLKSKRQGDEDALEVLERLLEEHEAANGSEQKPQDEKPQLKAQIVSALEAAGIAPQDTTDKSDDELNAIDGIGDASIKQIRAVYGEYVAPTE